MRIPSAVAVAVVLASLLSVTPARAEPFTILPNGNVVFNAALTTQAAFFCLQGLSASCFGSGTNALTFGSGADTTTIKFTGVDTTLAIGNSAVPVHLGQVLLTTTGGGFVFPEALNPNVGVLGMALTLTHESPVAASRTRAWRFHPRGDGLNLFMGQSYATFPLGGNPPGFNYDLAVYTFNPFPFTLRPGITNISADVGAVPEPGTLMLVGSGVAAVLLRRRRRGNARTLEG
jgi:hypothetical protein